MTSLSRCFVAALSLFSVIQSIALPNPQSPDGSPPQNLIGDLRFKQITPVGISVANIILSTESGESSVIGTRPKGNCKKSTDPCCIWYAISADLTNDFLGRTGLCNNNARAAIRLGFHDAGAWSQPLADAGQDFGGADGSFVLFNEIQRPENKGLEEIAELAKRYQKKYNVGMGDLIQYMSIHATVTCPLGPRVRAFVGRKDATQASPPGLLPDVHAPADQLIALFGDKTITPHDLTALLGAHSTSRQFNVDTSVKGAPQDTTPGVWDVGFFNETLQPKAAKHTFRFPADEVLSRDSRMNDEWTMFSTDQSHWNRDYASAYVRLSMLGVNNINELTECSATLPAARPTFNGAKTEEVVQA